MKHKQTKHSKKGIKARKQIFLDFGVNELLKEKIIDIDKKGDETGEFPDGENLDSKHFFFTIIH